MAVYTPRVLNAAQSIYGGGSTDGFVACAWRRDDVDKPLGRLERPEHWDSQTFPARPEWRSLTQKRAPTRGSAGRLEVESNGVKGAVQVVIHINRHVASEATADAPSGIAKTSVKVE